MNIFQSLFYLIFFWHLTGLIIPSLKLISSFEFHDTVLFWISFSSWDIFFRAPFTWSVTKFGFLQAYWSSFHYILSLDFVTHPWVLNYHLKTNNPQYVSSAEVRAPPSTYPWFPLLHSNYPTFLFPVCMSATPPPLSPVQKTLRDLVLPLCSHS